MASTLLSDRVPRDPQAKPLSIREMRVVLRAMLEAALDYPGVLPDDVPRQRAIVEDTLRNALRRLP